MFIYVDDIVIMNNDHLDTVHVKIF